MSFDPSKQAKDLYARMAVPKKEKIDFTEILAVQLPQNRELAVKQKSLPQALENLLALEKQTRQALDLPATTEVALCITSLCRETNDWPALNNSISILVKRRGQLKQVVTKVVQEGMKYLDETPDMEHKLTLINTLRAVSEGKIHTELERARLTRILAKIKEDEGNIAGAAEVLQEVQVETYGSMEREEKMDFILEQIRLCLDSKEWVRASILGKKINTKHFKGEDFQEIKLRFYALLNRLHFHNDEYLELAKSYYAIYNTPVVQADAARWKEALRDVVIFLVLSQHGNEQSDMLHRVAQEKNLEQIVEWRNLLHHFKSTEITRWPIIKGIYEPLLAAHPQFAGEQYEKRISVLHGRVTEHNIRIVAEYYSRITMDRLTTLLDLDYDTTEKHVCSMVADKQIFARIDRLSRICTFAARKDPNDVLNDWAHDISDLLGKLEKTCHLIHKEQMVHGPKKKGAK